MIVLEIKNMSKDQLNISADELMERFKRGDESRNTEGSGLGLSIAKDLTNLMDGSFQISIDGDPVQSLSGTSARRVREKNFTTKSLYELAILVYN